LKAFYFISFLWGGKSHLSSLRVSFFLFLIKWYNLHCLFFFVRVDLACRGSFFCFPTPLKDPSVYFFLSFSPFFWWAFITIGSAETPRLLTYPRCGAHTTCFPLWIFELDPPPPMAVLAFAFVFPLLMSRPRATYFSVLVFFPVLSWTERYCPVPLPHSSRAWFSFFPLIDFCISLPVHMFLPVLFSLSFGLSKNCCDLWPLSGAYAGLPLPFVFQNSSFSFPPVFFSYRLLFRYPLGPQIFFSFQVPPPSFFLFFAHIFRAEGPPNKVPPRHGVVPPALSKRLSFFPFPKDKLPIICLPTPSAFFPSFFIALPPPSLAQYSHQAVCPTPSPHARGHLVSVLPMADFLGKAPSPFLRGSLYPLKLVLAKFFSPASPKNFPVKSFFCWFFCPCQ